jgi:membrane-associated protease RseP (regulator of RpoE activity)
MFGADLSIQFRLLGIPVHVNPFFVLVLLILGRGAAKGSLMLLAAWVAIAGASVLLHELGHAVSARAFGMRPFIFLHGLGGVTAWRNGGRMTGGRRFVVSAAGPALGVLLGIVALVFYAALPDRNTTAGAVLAMVLYANLGWGILNLIPMLPLDGGQMVASVFDLISPGSGFRAARYVSILTAVVIAPLALFGKLFILALYCLWAIWMNVQELRAPAARPAEAVVDVSAQAAPPDEIPPGTRPS